MKLTGKFIFDFDPEVTNLPEQIQLGIPNDGRSVFNLDNIKIRIENTNMAASTDTFTNVTLSTSSETAITQSFSDCATLAGWYCQSTTDGGVPPVQAVSERLCWPIELVKTENQILIPVTTIYLAVNARNGSLAQGQLLIQWIINGSIDKVSAVEWQNLRIQTLGVCQ